MLGVIAEVAEVYYLHKHHAISLFLSLPECQCEDSTFPICQVVSQQKKHDRLISFCYKEDKVSMNIKVSTVFFQGEVLVEIPESSTNCGCPKYTCRMC